MVETPKIPGYEQTANLRNSSPTTGDTDCSTLAHANLNVYVSSFLFSVLLRPEGIYAVQHLQQFWTTVPMVHTMQFKYPILTSLDRGAPCTLSALSATCTCHLYTPTF